MPLQSCKALPPGSDRRPLRRAGTMHHRTEHRPRDPPDDGGAGFTQCRARRPNPARAVPTLSEAKGSRQTPPALSCPPASPCGPRKNKGRGTPSDGMPRPRQTPLAILPAWRSAGEAAEPFHRARGRAPKRGYTYSAPQVLQRRKARGTKGCRFSSSRFSEHCVTAFSPLLVGARGATTRQRTRSRTR